MEQCDPYCLQRSCFETAAKGTFLEEVVGKEDPVELDNYLVLVENVIDVEYVGGNTKLKYHFNYSFLS